MQMQQVLKTRTPSTYVNKLSNNDSSHNRSINDKLRINTETTEHIKEQLEQSLRAQRLAYKRSSVNNEMNSANKKICLDAVSNAQSSVTSSSTQRMKLVPGKIIKLIIISQSH